MNSLFRSLLLALAASTPLLTQADTLVDIYELALKNDASLKAAEATYRAEMEVENQTRSALLPQINATAGYTESDTDYAGAGSAYGEGNSDTDTSFYGATLDQTLFDLSAWYSFKSGKETSKKAEAQLAFEQQNLIVRVAEAYFNVLRSLDNLEASKARERANQRQLEQAQQRFDVGLIAITDVHEARAGFDDAVVQRLTDEGNLGTSYEALAVLTGQTHANLSLLGKDFPVVDPAPVNRDEWVQFALKNNNALKAASYAAEAAHQNASAKKMGHAPTISGQIAYEDSDTDGNFSATSGVTYPSDIERDGTTLSINLRVPIFSGGGISASRRQAYEQYNAALQQQIDTQRNVIKNTRSQHINVMNNVERVKARQQAIVSARSALDATQAGYEVGTRNIVDVLDAQNRMYATIRDYANSRYDYVINMLNLKLAAGTLTPQDIYTINKWLVAADAPTANQYKDYLNQ